MAFFMETALCSVFSRALSLTTFIKKIGEKECFRKNKTKNKIDKCEGLHLGDLALTTSSNLARLELGAAADTDLHTCYAEFSLQVIITSTNTLYS